MYRISTKGQYALMTMEVLAEQQDNTFVPMKKISHRQNLSIKYLEQILITLGKAGLVEGLRGSNGGYRLTKSAEEYTVGEILRAMEGDLSSRSIPAVSAVKSAGNESFWKGFDKVINDYVNSVSLDQIVKKSHKTDYMFYI